MMFTKGFLTLSLCHSLSSAATQDKSSVTEATAFALTVCLGVRPF